jgi:hypothetical protein
MSHNVPHGDELLEMRPLISEQDSSEVETLSELILFLIDAGSSCIIKDPLYKVFVQLQGFRLSLQNILLKCNCTAMTTGATIST